MKMGTRLEIQAIEAEVGGADILGEWNRTMESSSIIDKELF
jgi:hypothetical protein